MTERKIGLLLLTFLLMLVMIGAASAQSTGDGFVWDESTKTLTVTDSTGDYSSASESRPYLKYQSKAEHLVIDGDENTSIGSYAFNGFFKLKTVEIKTCGNIGNRAFGGCAALTGITINKCSNIAGYAFQNCSSLTQANIGTCGNIATDAFSNCRTLQKLTITNCGDLEKNAFHGLSKLEAVSIDRCGNIGNNAFGSCTALTELSLNQCKNIGDGAFRYCTALKQVTLPDCGDIGKSAFGQSGVESIVIGNCGNVASRGFSDASNPYSSKLKVLEIGSCGAIGANACSNTPLTTVKIDKCASIGQSAFAFTSKLQELELKDCASIAMIAFQGSGAPIRELTLENCTVDEMGFYIAKIDKLTLKNLNALGDGAFQSSTIKSLTLSNIATLGSGSFAGCKGLTELTIEDIKVISDDTFKVYDTTVGNKVTKIVLRDVEHIGNYAFKNFSNLKNVIIEGSCDYVGAHAFSGCEKLETIDIADNTKLGYSDSFVNQPYVHDRVTAILQGSFALDSARKPVPIAPLGWTSYRTGEQNRAEQPGDTQLTKEARWINETCTTAEVLIQGYYTPNRQMDFIFVADCSNSMSGLGSADAMNSNFYNMQSKMMDVADVLLAADDLDTQVAFATFGETDSSVSRFFGKGESDAAKAYIWNDIVNYYSNTNYSAGLQAGLDLVESNAGRNMTVIFLSDGQPYSSEDEIPASYYGRTEAAAIRSKGVKVLSVLQQVSQSELASSIANMEGVADQVFHSTDLEGFSKAVNSAIEYAYSTFILDDIVHPNFDLDTTSIKASAGTFKLGKDKNGNTVIRWDLSGHPFEKHTLSFKQNLLSGANGVYPSGNLDTNAGDALLMSGGREINSVKTPVLPREDSASPVAPPPKTGDDSQLFQWTLLLLLSAAVLATLLISRIKQRQKP